MEIKRNKGFHWIPFCYTQKFEDGKYKRPIGFGLIGCLYLIQRAR